MESKKGAATLYIIVHRKPQNMGGLGLCGLITPIPCGGEGAKPYIYQCTFVLSYKKCPREGSAQFVFCGFLG